MELKPNFLANVVASDISLNRTFYGIETIRVHYLLICPLLS